MFQLSNLQNTNPRVSQRHDETPRTAPKPHAMSDRMSTASAQTDPTKVIQALTRNAAPEPPHTSSILVLASHPSVLTAVEQHFQDCIIGFRAAKVRGLGNVLLSHLFGVKHPSTAFFDSVVPETHFINWLAALPNRTDRVFHLDPAYSQQHPLPLGSLPLNNENTHPQARTPPSTPILASPSTIGRASRLTVEQILELFQRLGKISRSANIAVHALTVADVVRVLMDSMVKADLGGDVYQELLDIVEAILPWPISRPNSADLEKPFKPLVKSFRMSLVNAPLFMAMQHTWAKAYHQALQSARTADLVRDGYVISKAEVRERTH